ncbi:MAG: fatty acid desaturase [Polyangiaceae bacterium]
MSTAAPESLGGDAPPCAPTDPRLLPDPERFQLFGEEVEALKALVFAKVGEEDVRYVKRLSAFSRVMEVVGRGLIHFSFEPLTFGVGVVALWVHKQLDATEIGHTALHGAYDRLPGAERFSSKTYRWNTPIDEESWRYGHNVRHHGGANVAGKDADIHFGPARLTKETPHRWHHELQLPFMIGVLAPNFAFLMNLHFTGLSDLYSDNGLPEKLDFLPDRSPESARKAWRAALRKYVPYYLYNYVLFPALAGPLFWKVLLGNWLAETMRDVYSAATIYCGHVGPDVASYPAGTKPMNRGHWYAMQVEASQNFEVSEPVSMLCGGLDRQIEHHMFPTLAPPRLREIAPEVRALCEKYGIAYRTDSWGRTLKKALKHVRALAKSDGVRGVVREMA